MDDLSGTWHENQYPNDWVETRSFLYKFKFIKNYPWSEYYASRHLCRHRGDPDRPSAVSRCRARTAGLAAIQQHALMVYAVKLSPGGGRARTDVSIHERIMSVVRTGPWR